MGQKQEFRPFFKNLSYLCAIIPLFWTKILWGNQKKLENTKSLDLNKLQLFSISNQPTPSTARGRIYEYFMASYLPKNVKIILNTCKLSVLIIRITYIMFCALLIFNTEIPISDHLKTNRRTDWKRTRQWHHWVNLESNMAKKFEMMSTFFLIRSKYHIKMLSKNAAPGLLLLCTIHWYNSTEKVL